MVPSRTVYRHVLPVVSLLGALLLRPAVEAGAQTASLAERVEIRRTSYGVPHILGEDLASAFFGLAYCHVEDYGERVVMGLIRARGELARYLGPDSLDSDFRNRRSYARAVKTYHLLDHDIRDVFEGYAAGVNHYVQLHPDAS
jgi:acyl-homoserine-lactone acylase